VTPPVVLHKAQSFSEDTIANLGARAYVWHVSAGVLVMLLLWQLLMVQRNWLGSEEPALRPWLSAMCRCEILWPMEPEAVLIESSSFTENSEGGYTVQLRLKNTQHHAVAMPALELNLTDAQDQVLVRRVFRAKELSAKDHLQALRDVRTTLHFDLDDKVSKRITGFRAIVFYP
jgi:SLAP domain-containing protein